MENYQGDLADIVRSTSATTTDGGGNTTAVVPDWPFPSNDPINYSCDPAEDFGDPFSFMGDPLLQNMDPPVSGFFFDPNLIEASTVDQETGNTEIFCGNGGNNSGSSLNDHETKGPSNIFSRMLQISPNNAKLPAVAPCDTQTTVAAEGSPRGLKGPPPLLLSDNRTLISPSRSSKGCLVESTTAVQISSPRNTGIKRRKSQAKKVVCIPAAAPANGRAGGEVVPSDLWAWRKYGQKPIKGSPYPRGYYRCSSSKGCSARKQVERSRTDPNMLVITYTSEHNHPWPTQRNALAGSTRSQPSKTNNCDSKNPPPQKKPTYPRKQEQKMDHNTVDANSTNVKEEMDREFDSQLELMNDAEFDEHGSNCRPTLLADSNQPEDSFFADLGEIESDPFAFLFTQGFCGDVGRENKDLDPFGFYDLPTNDSNITAAAAVSSSTSCGEANVGNS